LRMHLELTAAQRHGLRQSLALAANSAHFQSRLQRSHSVPSPEQRQNAWRASSAARFSCSCWFPSMGFFGLKGHCTI
jgi:hypothetical protein